MATDILDKIKKNTEIKVIINLKLIFISLASIFNADVSYSKERAKYTKNDPYITT